MSSHRDSAGEWPVRSFDLQSQVGPWPSVSVLDFGTMSSDRPTPVSAPSGQRWLKSLSRRSVLAIALLAIAYLLGWRSVGPAGSHLTQADLVATTLPSVALVEVGNGSGSGWVLANGLIVTNKHVIDGQVRDVTVTFPSVKPKPLGPLTAKVVHVSEDCDLAFLQIDCRQPPLKLAEPATVRLGQRVMAIGSPGIESGVIPNAVSSGTLSTEFAIDGQSYYQLDMIGLHGQSGGPILDEAGCVVGVLTRGVSDGNGNELDGITLCVPVRAVRKELDRYRGLTADELSKAASRWRQRVLLEQYAVGTWRLLFLAPMSEIFPVFAPQVTQAELVGFRPESLKAEMAELQSDPSVPPETKALFADLAKVFGEAAQSIRQGSGARGLDIRRHLQLRGELERVAGELKRRLDAERNP